MGHLNSFSARGEREGGGGDLNKTFSKIQMPERLPRGDVGSFDFTGTLSDIPRMVKDDTSDLEVACSVVPALEQGSEFPSSLFPKQKYCVWDTIGNVSC